MNNSTCSVDECLKPHYGKGWCSKHYTRMRRNGTLELEPKAPSFCKVEGCGVQLVPPYGRGMCQLHYKRYMKHGDVNYQRPLVVGVAECSIDGCDGVVQARGWCSKHWSKWDRYGNPEHRYRYEVQDGKRICAGCNIDKPVEEFGLNLNSYCMRCAADRAIARRKAGLVDQDKVWQ